MCICNRVAEDLCRTHYLLRMIVHTYAYILGNVSDILFLHKLLNYKGTILEMTKQFYKESTGREDKLVAESDS